MPRYTFLPWARPDLRHLPAETLAAALPATARTRVELTLNRNAPIGGDVLVEGPGDVLGIDPRQIVRMEPTPGTTNFEANYFPAVEFARPDFPWLFTPASANNKQQIRPWLVLAVVRKQPGVAVLRPERQLPILEIKAPARAADELPELSESWAWAHAQIADQLPAGESLDTIVAREPGRAVSRLLYPRALQPDAGYYACLVPAFEVGRLAGLGLSTESVTTLAPAWEPRAPAVVLPVYHVWEFATGPGGDFESLLQLLLDAPSKEITAPRPRIVDAANAGDGLPKRPTRGDTGAMEFALECPLMSVGSTRTWTEAVVDRFASALRAALAQTSRGDPRITAPVYGAEYVPGAKSLEGAAPRWLRELNLDPRFRLSASFGAEIVRRNQDRLVDSAWDQAGDIRAANQLIRHAETAAIAAARINQRHFSRLQDSALLEITRPLHTRIALQEGQTFRALLAKSALPPTVTAAEFQRIARPSGPVLRRTRTSGTRTVRPFLSAIASERLILHLVRPTASIATPEGVEAGFKAAGGSRTADTPAVAYGQLRTEIVDKVPARPSFAIFPPNLPRPPGSPLLGFAVLHTGGSADNETARRFRAALKEHLPCIAPPVRFSVLSGVTAVRAGVALGAATARLASTATARATTAPAAASTSVPQLQVREARVAFERKLAPTAHFAASVQARLTLAGGPAEDPRLTSLQFTPTYSEPLYAALAAISPDLVVQGFETIGANTITPLQTNPEFVAAFLAGANHELSRELFWREFPAESGATFFQQFWDTRAGPAAAAPDIAPLTSWDAGKSLGAQATSNSRAVFLIRGELIRRYPTAIVYLVESGPADAEGRPTLTNRELHPVIRGTVAADAAFYGFDVAPEALTSEPGWIVVVQEPPAEPRFGIEVDDDPAAIAAQADAAKTAKRFLQHPVRCAIHARDLMPHHA